MTVQPVTLSCATMAKRSRPRRSRNDIEHIREVKRGYLRQAMARSPEHPLVPLLSGRTAETPEKAATQQTRQTTRRPGSRDSDESANWCVLRTPSLDCPTVRR